MTGRPINENRMIAELAGEKTYRGSEHECGTNERYTKGGACVHCARRIQREQRQARVAELAAAAEQQQTGAFLDLADSIMHPTTSDLADEDYFNSPTVSNNPWD